MMFGMAFHRHRLFATDWFWLAPGHPQQYLKQGLPGGAGNPVNTNWRMYHDGVLGNGAQKNGVADGHAKGWRLVAEAMGIDWMKREELTQAIPPAFTKYVGEALLLAQGAGDAVADALSGERG